MTEQVWWYATRAAGLMAWSTAVASVLLGLLLSPRLLGRRTSGTWLFDVHRFLGGLSAVFLLIHLGSLWLDSAVDFGARDLLVPGESTWNPSAEFLGVSAITWGIAAAYSLIAVEITSILRPYLRDRIWKATHYLSVVTVGAGTVHAYQAGTDFGDSTAPAIALAMSLMVVLASVIRMRRASSPSSPAAQAEMLEEMRQRLADLPIPPSMNEPVLELDAETELPRRAPGGPDETVVGVPTDLGQPVEGFPFGSDLVDPGLVTPVGENTLLADAGMGAAMPPGESDQSTAPIDADSLPGPIGPGPGAASIDAVAERLGPDPFAGIQGDDGFDPGGWSGGTAGAPNDASGANDAFGDDDAFGGAAPVGEFKTRPLAPPAQPHQPAPADHQPPPAQSPTPPASPDIFDPQALLAEIRREAAGAAPPESPPPLAEPTVPPPPLAPEHRAGGAQPADVWEDALDSALDERLPKLPHFEPMPLPERSPQSGPPGDEPPPRFGPASDLAPPASPVVEQIAPSPAPATPPPADPTPSPLPSRAAPPPLPIDAVDPSTGQADEEAYKAWLVEWLAFAERYGDEAPVDPTRVDG